MSHRHSQKWRLIFVILGVALSSIVALWVAGEVSPGAAGLGLLGGLLLTYLAANWLMGQGARPPLHKGETDPVIPQAPLPPSWEHEALTQVSRAAELMSEPAQFYRWLTQRLAGLLDLERSVLILCHPDGEGAFRIAVPAHGFTLEGVDALRAWVDAAGDDLAIQGDADEQIGLLHDEWNVVSVPLFVSARLVGAIRLSNKRGSFSTDDLRLLNFLADRLAATVENAQLYQALQDRLEEISLLYNVGVPLSGALDFDEVISRAVRAIQSMFGCDQVNLFLVDEGSETLHLHGSLPPQALGAQGIRVLLGDGIIGQVAETGELLHLTGERSGLATWSLLPQVRSELCVPLKLGSWVIGVIDAQSSQPDAFGEKDVRRLGIFAGQLATMLQSARLYEATRQRAAELALLYDATVAMSAAELDRTGVTELVMKRLISAIQVDGGRLGLWDHSTNTLVTRFVDGPTILTGQVSLENERQVEEYFLHYLLTGRKPLTLYENDPDLDRAVAQAMREKAIQSALILPLVAHNRVIGLVELTRTISHRFTPEEMRLALTLATQASIAMENARLYQETKLAVEELAALQALALDITAQIALPELLERLMMRARNLVRADGSAIYLMDLQDGALIPVGSDLPWSDIESSVVQKGLELAQDVVDGGRALSRSTGSFPVPADASEPVRGQKSITLSCACVPLRWREQLVGVLSVFRAEDEPSFAAQQIYLLELLAPQAAISIRNVQLYEELEQRMRDLELAQASLIQAEKAAAIGRLAASLGHEINNPLQSLNNCLHLSLRPDLVSEKKEMYLSLAQDEMERLIAIVNRMLNLYRPATGETRSETSINRLLNDVLALLSKQLEHGKIEVELDLDPGLPLVLAIPNNLRQVFLNLILNAVDAMPGGGRLGIATHQSDDEQVGVIVRDTGRGIPAEDLSRIYEPFFTTKEKGTGLGLSISYGIVEAHKGKMQVESSSDTGTTFSLKFPIGKTENE